MFEFVVRNDTRHVATRVKGYEAHAPYPMLEVGLQAVDVQTIIVDYSEITGSRMRRIHIFFMEGTAHRSSAETEIGTYRREDDVYARK